MIIMIIMINDGKQGQDKDKDKEMEVEWITSEEQKSKI